jgi:glutathione S-transferase
MSFTLHFHPLSSYCQKVLIGLYELDVAFTPKLVDLQDEAERAELMKLWPMGKFPVLRDHARELTVPESSIILEYVDRDARLIPADRDRARDVRLRDRFYDLHIHDPMQRIVADKLRPAASRDPFGVEQARAQLAKAYAIADEMHRGGTWAVGDAFTMADCAAAPSLFYAGKVQPFESSHRHLASYFARLVERPSFARVIEEAKPYWAMFPG